MPTSTESSDKSEEVCYMHNPHTGSRLHNVAFVIPIVKRRHDRHTSCNANFSTCLFVYLFIIIISAYIHLRFKHTVLDTHQLSGLSVLSRTVS